MSKILAGTKTRSQPTRKAEDLQPLLKLTKVGGEKRLVFTDRATALIATLGGRDKFVPKVMADEPLPGDHPKWQAQRDQTREKAERLAARRAAKLSLKGGANDAPKVPAEEVSAPADEVIPVPDKSVAADSADIDPPLDGTAPTIALPTADAAPLDDGGTKNSQLEALQRIQELFRNVYTDAALLEAVTQAKSTLGKPGVGDLLRVTGAFSSNEPRDDQAAALAFILQSFQGAEFKTLRLQAIDKLGWLGTLANLKALEPSLANPEEADAARKSTAQIQTRIRAAALEKVLETFRTVPGDDQALIDSARRAREGLANPVGTMHQIFTAEPRANQVKAQELILQTCNGAEFTPLRLAVIQKLYWLGEEESLPALSPSESSDAPQAEQDAANLAIAAIESRLKKEKPPQMGGNPQRG